MAKVKYGLAKKARIKRGASRIGYGMAVVGGLGVAAGVASGQVLTIAPSLGLLAAGIDTARKLGKEASRLEGQARVVGQRLATARAAARATSGAMRSGSILGSMARRRAAQGKPAGDGSVDGYTRTQNGKTVQVGGYQRAK